MRAEGKGGYHARRGARSWVTLGARARANDTFATRQFRELPSRSSSPGLAGSLRPWMRPAPSSCRTLRDAKDLAKRLGEEVDEVRCGEREGKRGERELCGGSSRGYAPEGGK